jgi:2-polyprenyl-6-methoxyphenol hydroxylase-like FAD-dependent oxidoreductase
LQNNISTTCVIAGGGPAGIMAGYLLARAGVDVTVLEKHKDFFRDFRGDTIHPSTMQVMDELGLLDEFLKVPHEDVDHVSVEIGGEEFRIGNFSHLPVRCKYIAFMPQWDFLSFLSSKGKAFPGFHLMMETEAQSLVRENGHVVGLKAKTNDGEIVIKADLVIGADGRHSTLRDDAGYKARDLGAPMDVLWFRLAHDAPQEHAVFGRVESGQMMVMLDRKTYWQCALIIAKGAFDDVKAGGLEAFRARVAKLAGRPDAGEIKSWDDVRLLTVAVDRLERWHEPGLLFIGDAAHAMSPIGGVGINLAVQDAIAAANILFRPLKEKTLGDAELARVQARRWFPTWATQAMQVTIQNKLIIPVLKGGEIAAPWFIRLAAHSQFLQRIPARVVGMGFRPEHISPELKAAFAKP